MTAVQVFAVSTSDLSVLAMYDGRCLHARMVGHVDSPTTRRDFAESVDRLRQEARLLRVGEVVVDVRELRFLDTSSLRQLIGWIADLRNLEPEAQYRVRLVSSGGRWQESTLPMLRALAFGLVTVVNEP